MKNILKLLTVFILLFSISSWAAPSSAINSASGNSASGSETVAEAVADTTDLLAMELTPDPASTSTPTTAIAADVASTAPDTSPLKASTIVNAPATKKPGTTGLGLKFGTLGMGLELTHGFSDSFGVRGGVNKANIQHNFNSGSATYDLKIQLETFDVLADWFPFQGSFRTTAGLFYNKNQFGGDAYPTNGTYTINGQTYTSSQVGSLSGNITFNPISPYLGIGWGDNLSKKAKDNSGFAFSSDFGLLFQTPKASLTTTSTLPAVQNAVAAQQTTFQHDVSGFKIYPVMEVGLTYRW